MNTKVNINQINDIVNSVIQQIDREEQSVSFEIRQKQEGVDKNFEITHREMVARFCESGGDPMGKVKAYIIRNTRMDCGLYFNSIQQTCEIVGVGKSTVQKVFMSLQYDDVIRLYKAGIWAIHPKFLRKGNSGKYIGQLRFYNSLPRKKRPDDKKQEEEDSELLGKLRELERNEKK